MMKIERLSRREPKQKLMTAVECKEYSPQQDVDILYARMMSTLFENWDEGPGDTTQRYKIDRLYKRSIEEFGKNEFLERIQDTIETVISGLTVWDGDDVNGENVIQQQMSFIEDPTDEEYPLEIRITIEKV